LRANKVFDPRLQCLAKGLAKATAKRVDPILRIASTAVRFVSEDSRPIV
jgi:hypothetical protein